MKDAAGPGIDIVSKLEKFVESKIEILNITQGNVLGFWSTRIWLNKTKKGTFTCSAKEKLQECGVSRDLPANKGLRSGSEIYEAVANFTDNYELCLDDADWHDVAKALATFNQELESEFLVAWQEYSKSR